MPIHSNHFWKPGDPNRKGQPLVSNSIPNAVYSDDLNEIVTTSFGVFDKELGLYQDEINQMLFPTLDYITFAAKTDAAGVVSLSDYTAVELEYSFSKFEWFDYTGPVTVEAGESVSFRNKEATGSFSTETQVLTFSVDSGIDSISGNPASLLVTNSDFPSTCPDYAFKELFKGLPAHLTNFSAINLTFTTVGSHSFEGMFEGCTGLKIAPSLKATALGTYAYATMFKGCTALEIAPAIEASTLGERAMSYMFDNCSALTIPATVTAHMSTTGTNVSLYCYEGMYRDCISLTYAPELSDETLAEGCYSHMFEGCIKISTAPKLAAPTLAPHCYDYMFKDCVKLRSIICLAQDLKITYDTATSTYTFGATHHWTEGLFDPGIPMSETCIFYKSAGTPEYQETAPDPQLNAWQWNGTTKNPEFSGLPKNWELRNYGNVFARDVFFENEYDVEDPITGEITHVKTGYEASDVQAALEEVTENLGALAQGEAELKVTKQDRLIAGEGIEIKNNVIFSPVYDPLPLERAVAQALSQLNAEKQNRIIAGQGVTLENDVLSVQTPEGLTDDLEKVVAQAVSKLYVEKADVFQAVDGVKLENDILSLDPAFVNKVTRIVTLSLNQLQAEKQDRLIPGEGISIENGVISSPVYDPLPLEKLVAQAISQLEVEKQDRLIAGEGITLQGNTIEGRVYDTDVKVIVRALEQIYAEYQPRLIMGENMHLENDVLSSSVDTSKLERVLAQALGQLNDEKQDRLQAGTGVTIDHDIISVTDYSDVIKVLSHAILKLSEEKQDRLTAGDGVTITNNTIEAPHYDPRPLEYLLSQALSQLEVEKQDKLQVDDSLTLENNVLGVSPNSDFETACRIFAQALSQLHTEKQDKLTFGEGLEYNHGVVEVGTVEANTDTVERVLAQAMGEMWLAKQDKLICGNGLSMTNNTLECNYDAIITEVELSTSAALNHLNQTKKEDWLYVEQPPVTVNYCEEGMYYDFGTIADGSSIIIKQRDTTEKHMNSVREYWIEFTTPTDLSVGLEISSAYSELIWESSFSGFQTDTHYRLHILNSLVEYKTFSE